MNEPGEISTMFTQLRDAALTLEDEPNPLGIPSFTGFDHLAEQLRTVAGNRPPKNIEQQLRSDLRAYEAAWPTRFGAGWVPPKSIRPSDVLMLRTVSTNLPHLSDPNRPPQPGDNTLARLIVDAQPFWIPGQVAWGLARTDIPETDPNIRLPFPTTTVWFSEWPNLAEHDLAPSWVHIFEVIPRSPDGGLQWMTGWPTELFGVTIFDPTPNVEAGVMGEVRLAGVCLLADPGGAPLDAVVWIIAVSHRGGARDGGWSYLTLPGRPSLSTWQRFWWSLCAIVAWGDWVDERPFDQVRNRGARRRLGALDVGGIGPVRVLSAKHHPGRHTKREPDGTHASPIAHLRRGHWRNQRHGRQRSETKQIWIPPTVVNPDNSGDQHATVWTLPPPESIPDTPTPDNPTGRWRRET